MATTQQVKPNGGKNAVLKPLNLGPKAGTFRTRRTSDQVTESKVAKAAQVALNAKKRADAKAAIAKRAQERAAEAERRAKAVQEEIERKAREEQERKAAEAAQATAIANDEPVPATKTTSTVMAIEKTPEIEKLLNAVDKDFKKFFKHLQDTYGIQVGDVVGPELVKRGYISMKLRGYLQPQRKEVAPSASSESTGVAREAVRFMQHYKLVGLTPAWLNKEVKIKDDPHTYLVTGLRGKAHAVVLRRKDDMNQAFTVASADFKKLLQS